MQLFGKKINFSLGEERSRLLICVGISLIIWTLMKLSGDFYTTRNVYLEYELPPMMEFVQNPPDKLVATVYGTGLSIIGNYIRNPNPAISINLSENFGRNIERDEMLAATQNKLGITVTDLDRNYLSLAIDSMLTKKVPVRLVHQLSFAPDFFPTGPFRLSHDSVFVSGTPNQIAQVSEVLTENVLGSGINQNWTKQVKLAPPSQSGIQINPKEIELSIEVEQYTEKAFEVAVSVPANPDSIQLIPAEVELRCVVPLSVFPSLKPSDFTLEADLSSGLELASQNRVPVKVSKAPEGVRSVELIPPVVEYFIVQ